MIAATPSITGTEARWFYVKMAYACALVAFVGFAPTYWIPVTAGRFPGPPLLHLHGLLFSAWTVFFIVQTTLAAKGNIARHRSLGLLGVALATAMLFVGIMAAVHSIRAGIAVGQGFENRTFSIVPITLVLFFVGVVAIAIANVKRPEVHKRLMLVATISILPPAIARLVMLAASTPRLPGHTPPIAFSLIPAIPVDLLLVAAIVYDWRKRGRPHAAYVIAGIAMVALQIVRVPLGPTPAWHAVTDWLLAFAA